jgi:hypothetical protein
MYSDKPELECDVECFRNYFLIKFRRAADGVTMDFEQYEGKTFNRSTVLRIMQQYKIVTFNGKNYDFPMIVLALKGASNNDLKEASDAIVKGQLKPWQFEKRFGVKIPPKWDHVDLMEVAPGVIVSLKLYAARMHARKLQDLPFEEDHILDLITDPPIVREYCGNDLEVTALLKNDLSEELELRDAMSLEFGIDLRSKSDAQVAEAVLKKKVSQLLGWDVARPEVMMPGESFRYKAPPFIQFRSPELRALLIEIEASHFLIDRAGRPTIPTSLAAKKIQISSAVFKMGIGGLHSQEKSATHREDDDCELHDDDVTSFYPELISKAGMYPKNMGAHFLFIYRDIITKRIAAKRAGNKKVANSMKIMLNGTFGKLGSPYSIFYSPDLLIAVTVTGQLVLLMLIEMFHSIGLQIVSANTDGIVTKVPRQLNGQKAAVISAWEAITGFNTENTRYRSLHSRDVNSYVGVMPNGKTKTKGVFTSTGLMKNPANEIIPQAVIKAVSEGKSIEETICQCRDLAQFLTARRVNGGAMWDMAYLGKVVRFYRSTKSTTAIEYRTNGNKVPLSDNAMPVMEMPEAFPDDIDFGWYIREANDLLREVGVT